MTRLDRGDEAGAERLMRDNLAVTKRRMEARLAQLDEKFDEAGRYGATAGHEVHTEVLENLMNDVNRDRKLFDLYRKLTGDEIIYKRLEARRLRFEGALYTHEGEDACGETLNWEEAQRLYNLALERLEAGFALAKEVKETRVMASAKNNVGSTLIRLLQPEKALVAYQEGMQYAQQLPGEMYKGLVNLNLGNTYVWIGDPETSLRYSEPALASFKKMGRATWQANAVMNIGNAYMREQKYSMAWEHLRMALDLAKQSGEDRVRGRALLNLGMIAYQLKKPEAAAFVQQALDWFAKEGSEVYTTIEKEVVQQDGLRLLSRIAKGNGDEAAAKKYDRQFLDLINTDPDRYGKLRASPCFAIYQARPAGQPIAQK
jgi:tetratricopeptide (TPR) repeat protein